MTDLTGMDKLPSYMMEVACLPDSLTPDPSPEGRGET